MSPADAKKRPKGAIINGQKVKMGSEAVQVPSCDVSQGQRSKEQHDHGQGGSAQVEAVTDGNGVVRQIVVNCACGERIVIECQYKGE